MTDQHLDSDLVAGWAERRLPSNLREQVASHLAECASCRREVTDAATLIQGERRRRRRLSAVPLLATAAVLALVVTSDTFRPALGPPDEVVLRPGGRPELEAVPQLGAIAPVEGAGVNARGLVFSSRLFGRTVTWSTADPAIATVSNEGLVSGTAAGSATITATSEGKTGAAAITVAEGVSLSRIAGTWTGLVTLVQPQLTFEYTALITIDGRVRVQQGDLAGTVTYGGVPPSCSGEWRFQAAGADVFDFTELVTTGTNNCTSGGQARLGPFLSDGNRLNYSWTSPGGRSTGTAVLSRSP